MQPTSNVNNFFGVRVSQPGINVSNANSSQLLYENNYNTETFFDTSGNPVVIIGQQPDGSYGFSTNNGTIEVSNNGVPQIIIGPLPDGTNGMWISVPGVNVETANPAEPGQLIFNSSQDIFKIVAKGATTFTALGTNEETTQTIAHGLNYTPLINGFLDNSNGEIVGFTGSKPLPCYTLVAPDIINEVIVFKDWLSCWTDDTNIYIEYLNSVVGPAAPNVTLTVVYYLIQETATD